MDEKHSRNADPRPKRRRDRDNPYKKITAGIETNSPHYYLQFHDSRSVQHCLEIDRELFELLDQFELEDLSHLNEVDNHYEHMELPEESLNARAAEYREPLEEMVFRRIEKEFLRQSIARLPAVQRRRLVLYYFGEFTYRQIAEMEGCKYQTVQESISAALKKLKIYLE